MSAVLELLSTVATDIVEFANRAGLARTNSSCRQLLHWSGPTVRACTELSNSSHRTRALSFQRVYYRREVRIPSILYLAHVRTH